MSALPKQTHFTPEDYLALERAAEYKSEYLDGDIIAMTGASRAHNLVRHNIDREIGNQVLDRPCEVYSSDMRVKTGKRSAGYTYPDIVVVCSEPEFEDSTFDTLLNPTVIVEILSPSTESYDRGKKFARYRQIPSLREYLLIAQDEVHVEHFVRQGETWVLSEIHSLEESLELPSIGCILSGAQIYQKVQFPEAEEAEES